MPDEYPKNGIKDTLKAPFMERTHVARKLISGRVMAKSD
jgi:hypothetical protein